MAANPTPIGQALTQQITQSTEANMQTLSANPANTVIQTIGGQKAITTNGGKLTIGGVGGNFLFIPLGFDATAKKAAEESGIAHIKYQESSNTIFWPIYSSRCLKVCGE